MNCLIFWICLDIFGYFWIYYDILKREMDTFWGLYINKIWFSYIRQIEKYHRTCDQIQIIDWWIWRGLLDACTLVLLGNKHVRCKPDVAPRLTSGGYEDKVDVITPINIYIYMLMEGGEFLSLMKIKLIANIVLLRAVCPGEMMMKQWMKHHHRFQVGGTCPKCQRHFSRCFWGLETYMLNEVWRSSPQKRHLGDVQRHFGCSPPEK